MIYPTIPIGAAFDIYNGATPSTSEPRFWDGDVPWIGPADLGKQKSGTIFHGERFITAAGYDSCGTRQVPKGSIILSVRAPIGHIAVAGISLCFNQGCRGLIPRKCIISEYAYWALQAARPALEAAGQGTTFIELSRGKLKAERISLPDLETQKEIAEFLDCETDRIEQLIRKKESFILLVQEKKQALSNQILDGSILNLDQSGIKGWFGSLPISWPTLRGKFLFNEAQGRSETGDEELLTVSHITGVTKRSEKDVNMFMAETMEGYKLVSKGDIIVNTMWAWMGAMGVSPHDGLISPSYGVYRPLGKHFEDEYLDLILRSKAFIAESTRRSKGIHSSRLRLYPDAFLDILFPLPSLDEQKQILSEYNKATAKEDKLVELNAKSIELLKEFKSSLITEAVTGQLDIELWKKRGSTDERLDNIEEAMRA